MKYVVRCRWISGMMTEGGVGWLTKDAQVSRDPRQAQLFDSEADAWTFAACSGNIGQDDAGDYCWVEALDTASSDVR